jgi:hypothetical protein
MNWTYTNNPGGSTKDALRLAGGDTNQEDPRLSDEEVNHFLNLYPGSMNMAAADAAEAIAARYSSMAVSYVGDLDNSPHLKAEYYLKLARQLRSREVVEEVEEAEKSIVASPGCSAAALHRGAIFKRESGL